MKSLKKLQISKSLVYRLMKTGLIRFVQVGRSVRVVGEDLDAFVQENRHEAKPEWISELAGKPSRRS